MAENGTHEPLRRIFEDYFAKREHTNPGVASAMMAMSNLAPGLLASFPFEKRFEMVACVVASSKRSIASYTEALACSQADLARAMQFMEDLLGELSDFVSDTEPPA